MSSKMGDSLFKLRRYNRVFLEIWAQIPIWTPMLIEQWAVGSFFLWKYSRRAYRDPQKVIVFSLKTSKWEKWWSWWLRMANAFILCYLLWKVQKCLAANREGSFNECMSPISGVIETGPTSDVCPMCMSSLVYRTTQSTLDTVGLTSQTLFNTWPLNTYSSHFSHVQEKTGTNCQPVWSAR